MGIILNYFNNVLYLWSLLYVIVKIIKENVRTGQNLKKIIVYILLKVSTKFIMLIFISFRKMFEFWHNELIIWDMFFPVLWTVFNL